MKPKPPVKQKKLSEALHRRVDHLVLSADARNRVIDSACTGMPPKTRYWPGLGWAAAAAACLLIAVLGFVRLRTSMPAALNSQIKCVSVVYADESRSIWLNRTVIVREVNGTESYIKVVAHNPRIKKRNT